MLNGMSLLSDANTIGTFSDEHPVANLDMFVLTTTQSVTSISPLPAPTPTKNLLQKLATTTPHETDHAILGIIECSKRGNASERFMRVSQNTPRIPPRKEVAVHHRRNRDDGSTSVGEETVVAGCVRNRTIWWCVNKKRHFFSPDRASHNDLLLLLNT